MNKSLSQVELNTVCVGKIGFWNRKEGILVRKCNVDVLGLGVPGFC
jgi:hypothetical protein